MAKTTKSNPDGVELGLLIQAKSDGDYFHITLHPVTTRRNEQGRLVHHTMYRATFKGLTLDGLRVHSQGNQKTLDERTSGLYGWEIRYQDIFSIDLPDAKRFVKTLATIDRRLDKLRHVDGYPKSFAEFALRAAKALGATQFFTRTAETRSGLRWSEELDYTVLSLGDGRNHIEYIERQWKVGEWKAA